VTTQGASFSVNGKDFKFVGTNAYWLPYLNSEDDISNTLANMSKAGITVVRTWAFNDVTTIPDKGSWLQLIKDGTTQFNTGANGIQRLDKVVELAKKYNIFVYFTLTNNWFPSSSDVPLPPVAPSPLPRNFLSNDYGGMDAYVREFGVEKKHDEFYTDMNIRQQFYKYLQFVVSRYVDEPTVLAWELANDARCNSTVPSSTQCNTNTVTLWHAQAAEFVRSIDPNHLVTSGNHGFFCPDCPKLFPQAPPPAPSPAPGSKRATGGPMTLSKLRRMVTNERRALPRAPGTRGIKIRGRWTVSSEAKRQSNNGAPAFNGAFGVDSQDILNAPQIDFGTFQLFPDQNNYGTTGVDVGSPSSAFDSTLNQTTAWINSQVDIVPSAGKPVILSAFGIVTQDNVQNFVPFNALSSDGTSSYKRQVGSLSTGVSQEQINSVYTAWLQTSSSGDLGGMNQYQWSSQNLVPETGTLVQSTDPGGTVGVSPNDGYGILGTDTSGVQQILNNAAQNTT